MNRTGTYEAARVSGGMLIIPLSSFGSEFKETIAQKHKKI
jgi:hypothetical protein